MSTNADIIEGKTPDTEEAFVVAGALCETQQTKQSRWENEQMIFANKLLAQVELAQLELKQLSRDMSLLMAMENALDVISGYLAEMRKLAKTLEGMRADDAERRDVIHEIRNLQSMVILYEETAEFQGVQLFDDASIRLASQLDEELYLSTSRLHTIEMQNEDNPGQLLECLTLVSGDINQRYKDVSFLMHRLQALFDGLRGQIETLISRRC